MTENSASVTPKPPTHYHVFPQNSTRPKTPGGAADWLTCATTSKRGYSSKSAARKARGQTPAGGSPLSVYRCASCSLYHLGHLPPSVRRGDREKS